MVSRRRTPSLLLAAVVGPAAVLFAVGADVRPIAETRATASQIVEDAPLCCVQVVTAPAGQSAGRQDLVSAPSQWVAASRLRAVDLPLPAGDAPERGLQVKTIRVARSVSADFPEIQNIGGVRPDALRWHPDGLALDVMIPNPGSTTGIALGNQIVSYVLKNADRFGVQDAIWRGTYFTPGGAHRGGYGHYDHVHITTLGGGYPTGGEVYVR